MTSKEKNKKLVRAEFQVIKAKVHRSSWRENKQIAKFPSPPK